MAALSLLACACLPDVELPAPTVENHLTAIIGTSPATRTSLAPEEDGVSRVLWSENDQIGVFVDGAPNLYPYKLVSGAGTEKAVFSGFGAGAGYIAVYPFDAVTGLSGETVSLTLPTEQNYTKDSFENGVCPMVAVSNTAQLSFRNLCPVLKLSMTGHHKVTSLVFRPNDESVKVAGPATVSLSNPDDPVLTVSQDGCDSLVLKTGSILLNDETPTDFYLVLPAQTYKGGFTVRVNTNTGYMEKKLNTDITLVRARKYDAAPFAVKLDVGAEPSVSLKGSGTEKDPFQIGSLGDLLLMQEAVNTENGMIKCVNDDSKPANTAYYLLTEDVDMRSLCNETSGRSWTPIGDADTDEKNVFNGVFDGGGHTISGLYINGEKDMQGLFGYVTGSISNLVVEGSVEARSEVALLVGRIFKATIDHCVARGAVRTRYGLAAGVIGQSAGDKDQVSFCVNEATVNGDWSTGGVIGSVGWGENVRIFGCTNKGDVFGKGQMGGIVGYLNLGVVYNCCNTGNITGTNYEIGGIIGFTYQGSQIYNCYNTGDITGSGVQLGGICGFLSSWCTVNYTTTVDNCYNYGQIISKPNDPSDEPSYGAIVGFSGNKDDGTYFDYYSFDESNSQVRNSYWLYDSEKGLGMEHAVGAGPGKTQNLHPLTEAQMKGAPCEDVLYSYEGADYSSLTAALNAGAYALKEVSWLDLSGWDQAEDGLPVLSDLPAHLPGSDISVFEVSEKAFTVLSSGGTIRVTVTSSLEYQIENLPGWIQEESVQDVTNQAHSKVHTFRILENDGQTERAGFIQFVNGAGAILLVAVNQMAPYLSISDGQVAFADYGGMVRIQVSSSIRWVASAEADWLSVSPASGEGEAAITIRAHNNESPNAREGAVTVQSEDGAFVSVIAVLQSGKTETAGDEWKVRDFYHQSLVMRFTGTWCGWCPLMNHSLTRAQELYPNKILQMALHGGGSKLDFGPDGSLTGTLYDQYMLTGYPKGIVDGRIFVANDEVEIAAPLFVNAAKETEEVYGTSSGVAIRSTVSGQNVQIDVDAYFKTAGDYKINVVLLEDGIYEEQSDYVDGYHARYLHDNVARVAVTDISGYPFSINNDLSEKRFSYSAMIPSSCNPANMRILVYIQKKFGSAPRIQTDNYGDYYVDNCATVELGGMWSLAMVGGNGGTGGGTGGGGGNEEIIPGSEIK